MRRQSAQSGHDFIKWQPHSSAVEFERQRVRHGRMHSAQMWFNVMVAAAIFAIAVYVLTGAPR